eukprot:2199674-Rhodomonas_salina.1
MARVASVNDIRIRHIRNPAHELHISTESTTDQAPSYDTRATSLTGHHQDPARAAPVPGAGYRARKQIGWSMRHGEPGA